MRPLPERGATIVPVVPMERYARSWPQPTAVDHERRFETPLDPGFADLVALRCVYAPAERGRYYAAACEDAVRAEAYLNASWYHVDGLGTPRQVPTEELQEELEHAQEILEVRKKHARPVGFEASVAAMRAIVRVRGLAGFVDQAEPPSVRPLVLEAEPGTSWELIDKASQYIDEFLHLLVCAVLVGTTRPSTAKLLECLGKAAVRSAGGATLAKAAGGLVTFLGKYAQRVPWMRAILDEGWMRCTLGALVAIGARLDATGIVGAALASATVAPMHGCAEWATTGLPRWTRGVVSIALAVLDIFVHATRAGPDLPSALATTAGLTEAAFDAHVDAVLDALCPERAAEYKRVVPRRILRTALAVALGARDVRDAIRKMHTGYAAALLECATVVGYGARRAKKRASHERKA
jgi:hypothetical protein